MFELWPIIVQMLKQFFISFELPEYLAQFEHWETRCKLSYPGVTSISFRSHPSIPSNVGLFAKLACFHDRYKVVYLHYRGSY